jgi:hypothetical protein
MYVVYLKLMEICLALFSKLLIEYVTLSNLTLILFNYTVNNYRLLKLVVEETTLKTETDRVSEK